MSTNNKAVMRFVKISFSILVILVVFIGTFKASTFCYEFGYRIFTEKPMAEEPGMDIVITIDKGDSISDISQELEQKGLIRDAWLFTGQYYLSAYVDELLPGSHRLNTSMTAKEMLVAMSTMVEEDAEVENE